MIFDLVAVALCLIGSGFFSASETALTSLPISRLEALRKRGGRLTRAGLDRWASSPQDFLITILVGNNLVNVLASALATSIAYRPGSAVGELIVVGRSQSILYPSEAFVWTGNPTLEEEEIGYFYDLEYILTKTGAGEASLMGSSWILHEATGISAAGDRIVGWGINPEGGVEAWLVTNFPYDELDLTHEE